MKSNREVDLRRSFRDKRILVTGAGGFIGSHLVEALSGLAGGIRAFVHYNSRSDWGFLEDLPQEVKSGLEVISADLRDYHAVDQATRGADIVFHLGSSIGIPYSLLYPRDVAEINILGTLNVLKASLENGVSRVIHTSTSEVYGTAKYVPIDEGHPLEPQSPYAATKIAADKLAESFHRAYRLPVNILRPFNTFGPRQSLRAIIPTLITQMLKHEQVLVGNISPRRDFTFVYDTVKGFLLLAHKRGVEGETFNLGTQRDVSIRELFVILSKIMGVKARLVVEEKRIRINRSEVLRLLSDNAKAARVLGWRPFYTLEEGLRITIEWLRQKRGPGKPHHYHV